MSWRRWPDVLVDYGQQLYIPWRLSQGDVLYRDVAYLHGPLSQYVNAVLFRVFGAGLMTLALFNLALTALLVGVLYALLFRLGGRISATAGALVFVAVFAFSQPTAIGNYNYVTPYVHEITHGVLLALLGILVLVRWDESGRPRDAALAGLLLGLTFLTKAEVFVAALAAYAVFAALAVRATLTAAHVRRRATVEAAPRPVPWLAVAAGALLPPALCLLLFSTARTPRAAFLATLGPFRPEVVFSPATTNVFFRTLMGTLDPLASLARIAIVGAAYAAVLGPAYLLARRVPPARARRAALLSAAAVAALLLVFPGLPWTAWALPFPFLTLAVGLSSARRLTRGGPPDDDRRERLRVTLATFGLALTAKIALLCVTQHYGFVLAMPATLVLVDAALTVVPLAIARAGGAPAVFRAAVAVVLLGASVATVSASRRELANKTVAVGSGRDLFFADARGRDVNAILAELSAAPPARTLAIVPEGAMLGYLSRRRNPTAYTNLMPPEVLTFSEERILAAFERHPPDLIAVVHKSTAEWGLPFFGRDYGLSIARFVDDRYLETARAGAAPLRDARFGIALLARREEPSAPPPGRTP